MKSKVILLLCTALLFLCTRTIAQDSWEEAVYLKGGNIYRGTIIEQIPNVSVKIETRDGNVFTVPMEEVSKITKERVAPVTPPTPVVPSETPHTDHANPWEERRYNYHDRESSQHKEFYHPKRGYFGQVNITAGVNHAGIRVINGYRFNRFAQLGIGVGIDKVRVFEDWNDFIYYHSRVHLGDGYYAPIFLHFTGEILDKRITPFYTVELGYGMQVYSDLAGQGIGSTHHMAGGVMGGAGVGVKFQSHSRFNLRVSLFIHGQQFMENSFPVNGTTYYSNTVNCISPGIRLGFGF